MNNFGGKVMYEYSIHQNEESADMMGKFIDDYTILKTVDIKERHDGMWIVYTNEAPPNRNVYIS